MFQYWDPDPSEITADVTITAMYSKEDPDANKLTVTFQDWDGTVIKEIKVSSGGSIADADLPNTSNLVRDGYIFIGWDRPLTNITESFTTMAQYKALSEDDIVVRYINSVTKEVFYQTTIKKGHGCTQHPDPYGQWLHLQGMAAGYCYSYHRKYRFLCSI